VAGRRKEGKLSLFSIERRKRERGTALSFFNARREGKWGKERVPPAKKRLHPDTEGHGPLHCFVMGWGGEIINATPENLTITLRTASGGGEVAATAAEGRRDHTRGEGIEAVSSEKHT